MDFIDDRFGTESQGWTRTQTARLAGHKVRATVYRDSYASQSKIYVEVWSPSTLSWNRIQTLSGTDFQDLPKMYAAEAARKKAAEPVLRTLFDYAKSVLED